VRVESSLTVPYCCLSANGIFWRLLVTDPLKQALEIKTLYSVVLCVIHSKTDMHVFGLVVTSNNAACLDDITPPEAVPFGKTRVGYVERDLRNSSKSELADKISERIVLVQIVANGRSVYKHEWLFLQDMKRFSRDLVVE